LATAAAVQTERQLRLLVMALCAAGAAEASIGIAQFITRTGPPSFAIGPFLRAYGTFGQPNPFAGYLAMVLPLALSLAFAWGNPLPRRRAAGPRLATRAPGLGWLAFSLAAAGLVGLAIVMSLSRGAWLGVVVGLAAIGLLLSRRAATLLAIGALAG